MTDDELLKALAAAYEWYKTYYRLYPHKDTRHGGDQIVYAFAVGILFGHDPAIPVSELVRLKQVQEKFAMPGSLT